MVDGQGKPVAEASIRAAAVEGHFDAVLSPPSAAVSGPAGRFRLRGLRAGDLYSLRALREGFAPGGTLVEAAEALAPGPTVVTRIVLAPGLGAFGRVVDARGRPVAGAELVLSPYDAQADLLAEPRRARSDPSGRFQFHDLLAGTYRLNARAPGFSPAQKLDLELPAGAARTDWGAVVLGPGRAVEGRVVDRRGTPIEGATISVVTRDAPFVLPDPFEKPAATTGADGAFRLTDLPPGPRLDLAVEHPAHPAVQVPGVEVPTPAPVTVEMEDGGTLSGRLVGPDGEPVVEAEVWRQEQRSVTVRRKPSILSSSDPVAVSDARGRFRSTPLAPGVVELRLGAEGYQPRDLRGLAVQAGRDLDLGEIALARGAVVEGRVVDGDGEPVPSSWISVQARPPDDGWRPGGPVRTDGEGRFRVAGLEPGRFEVSAIGPLNQNASVEVTVRPGTNQVEIAFPPGVEVRGRVLAESGEPLAGAGVVLRGPEGDLAHATSTADGGFRMPWVRPGEYRLRAMRAGYAAGEAPEKVAVAGVPIDGLEVRLAPREEEAGMITGRLINLPPEEMRRVWIDARSTTPDPMESRPAWLDGQGGYRIQDLEPGEWQVQASTGDRRASGTVLLVPGGTEPAVLDLDFGPPEDAVTVTGRVTAERRPVAGAQVILSGIEGGRQPQGEATSGYDGRFEIAGLPPGSYALLVAPRSGTVGHTRALNLQEDADLAIELETGGIEGRVAAADTGAPVAGALVTLEMRNEHLGTGFQLPPAVTAEDGSFTFPTLGTGSYVLKVEAEGYGPAEQRVSVRSGAPLRVEVQLRR